MTATPRTWFITGVSSGFGLSLAERVMQAGDYVIGTLRQSAQVEAFNRDYAGKGRAVQFDVTKPEDIVAAVAKLDRIDILVNNAGYGLFGAVEETSMQEARDQMETNFFGALALTQAVLPLMRKQKSGHIVQISSIAGFCSMPGLGLYNASKYALEGFSEALAAEVAPLGIKVLIVEPGPYRTKWAGGGARDVAHSIEDYAPTAHAVAKLVHSYDGNQPGDPDKAAQLIIKAVNSPNPPLRLTLGQMAIDRMREKIGTLQKELATWETESVATAFA